MKETMDVYDAVSILNVTDGMRDTTIRDFLRSLTKPVVLKAFRRFIMANHQDHTGEKIDLHKAVLAKEVLLNHCSVDPTGKPLVDDVLRTTMDTPLSELGNGLKSPKVGKECLDCEGRGWTKYIYQPSITCPNCQGKSARHFRNNDGLHCRRCESTGTVRSAKAVVNYLGCSRCNGTGEIEIFNPLIPKALMSTAESRRDGGRR